MRCLSLSTAQSYKKSNYTAFTLLKVQGRILHQNPSRPPVCINMLRARIKAQRAGHWGLYTPRKAQKQGARSLKAKFSHAEYQRVTRKPQQKRPSYFEVQQTCYDVDRVKPATSPLPYLDFEGWHILGVSCGVNKSGLLGMFLRVFVPIGWKNSGLVTSLGRYLIRYFFSYLYVVVPLGLEPRTP